MLGKWFLLQVYDRIRKDPWCPPLPFVPKIPSRSSQWQTWRISIESPRSPLWPYSPHTPSLYFFFSFSKRRPKYMSLSQLQHTFQLFSPSFSSSLSSFRVDGPMQCSRSLHFACSLVGQTAPKSVWNEEWAGSKRAVPPNSLLEISPLFHSIHTLTAHSKTVDDSPEMLTHSVERV